MIDRIDLLLGRRLRARRRLMGLTLAELAAAVGVRFQQVQKYECAASKISAQRLWQFACVLDVEVEYFYAGLHEMRSQAVVAASPLSRVELTSAPSA